MKIWRKTKKTVNRRGRVSPPEPQLDGTQPGTTQGGASLDSPADGSSDVMKTAVGALLNILEVAKEASAPLPPLQTALGAVVASIKIYNVGTDLLFSVNDRLMTFPNRNTNPTWTQSGRSRSVWTHWWK